jgi:hypothetical protein
MLQAGISRAAFHAHYRRANQDIVRDLPYGRTTRLLAIWLARYGLFEAVVRAARRDPRLRTALFNAVSAHAPYRSVLASSVSPHSLLAVVRDGLAPAWLRRSGRPTRR